MQRIEAKPEQYRYTFDPFHSPIASVRPGEAFEVVTQDAFGGKISETFLKITQINGKWYYSLRPELRELLESENIILNTNVPLNKSETNLINNST
jgi:hypothetical protein